MIYGLTRRKSSGKVDRPEPFANAKSIEDKIKIILDDTRKDDPEDERRRAQLYYRVDLYFRGYQNLGPFDEKTWTYSTDDDPMDSTENRFRRNVLINAGNLLKMEPNPVIRAASGSFNDLEAAKAAEDALDIQYERIDYEMVKADKALFKVLYGNAFLFTGWQLNDRLKKLMLPKFKYEDVNMPGEAYCRECGTSSPVGTPLCPECGFPMRDMPEITGKVPREDGFEEKPNGEAFTAVCTPLEIKCRPQAKGGLKHAPYVQWITAEDADLVEYIYPDLDIHARTASALGSDDPATRALRILSSLPGYIGQAMGRWGNWSSSSSGLRKQVMVNRAWIRPEMFRNDKAMLKAAPDGLFAVRVDDKIAEWKPAKIDDAWTHEVYIRVPHSLYGDGMFDDIPIQTQINRVNALQMRYMENCTSPKRLYDRTMIWEEDVLDNDPKNMWTPVSTEPDKGLQHAVRDLSPQQLPPNVPQWKQQMLQADKDVSRVNDPRSGDIAGANTPYAAYVFAAEQGQVADLVSMKYNAGAVRQHARQLLEIAKEHWTDEQTKEDLDENTGRPTWKKLTGADLARGEFTIRIRVDDFKPKSRTEAMYGMEYARNFGIDLSSQPKLRLEFLEKVGISTEGDMLSTQARRAFRQMEKILASLAESQEMPVPGQPPVAAVQPDDQFDDGNVQFPVLMEYLISPQGETLQEENPQGWQAVKDYAWTCLQMTLMRNAALAQAGGQPPQPGGEGQAAGAPRGTPKQQFSQSPVSDGMKPPLPPNPQPMRP